MTIPSKHTPELTHRRPSPGEPPEPVVVDADTRTELVVIAPRFGGQSVPERRYHEPNLDAARDGRIEPDCHVVNRSGTSWQYRTRELAEQQATCCRYCSGDVDHAEISAQGGTHAESLAGQLSEMSIEEFEARCKASGGER